MCPTSITAATDFPDLNFIVEHVGLKSCEVQATHI